MVYTIVDNKVRSPFSGKAVLGKEKEIVLCAKTEYHCSQSLKALGCRAAIIKQYPYSHFEELLN